MKLYRINEGCYINLEQIVKIEFSEKGPHRPDLWMLHLSNGSLISVETAEMDLIMAKIEID
jgi:hypothetical protein